MDILTIPTKLPHHRVRAKRNQGHVPIVDEDPELQPSGSNMWSPDVSLAPGTMPGNDDTWKTWGGEEHPFTLSHLAWVSAGVASGVALGYIQGNVPGAFIGGYFGYEAAHNRAGKAAGRIIWHTVGPG